MWGILLGEVQGLPVNDCPAASCDSGALARGSESTSFYSTILVNPLIILKLKFLMSYHRKNSVRDKVIGKKWIYLERNTFHRQSVGHLRRREQHQGMVLSIFIGVGNFIG